jgi:hypothetical protein
MGNFEDASVGSRYMRQQYIGRVPRTGDDGALSIEERGVTIRMLCIEESCVLSIRFFIVLTGHRLLIRRKLPVLGVDDAILAGSPTADKMILGSVDDLREPDAIIIDRARYRTLFSKRPA